MSSRLRAGAALAAVAVAPAVLRQQALHRRELGALRRVVEHRPARLRPQARLVTELGAVMPVSGAVAVATLQARRHGVDGSEVTRSLAVFASGIALRRLLAEMVRRERPPSQWWWSEPSGYSYPSRHVTWIALGTGTILDLGTGGRSSTLAGALRTTVVGMVFLTRVVLAVHWPTDVAAGLAYSAAWRRLWR